MNLYFYYSTVWNLCIKYYLFLIGFNLFEFNLVGGGINFKFGKKGVGFIHKNYFFSNPADFGGVLDYDIREGFAISIENYFLNNIGRAVSGSGAGSASSIAIRGTLASLIYMYYDKHYFNWSENKGTIISYGANIKIYGVYFYSNG